jgi:hypothetical protein
MQERFGLKEVCILNTEDLGLSDRLNRRGIEIPGHPFLSSKEDRLELIDFAVMEIQSSR